MSTIRVSARSVDVVNAGCEFRPCFRLLEDKGSFTPGVGYTSYYEKSRWVCGTRHLSGCPHVGGHVVCRDCGKPVAEYVGDPLLPSLSPCCNAETYNLADLLPPVEMCCSSPEVPKIREGRPAPYRQKCRSCGTSLTGERLEAARATSVSHG